jgi:glucosylceramidase
VNNLVIGNTRNWGRTIMLWSLALDQTGKPNVGGCQDCRGVVTINNVTGEITRNEEYYALAHFGRVV